MSGFLRELDPQSLRLLATVQRMVRELETRGARWPSNLYDMRRCMPGEIPDRRPGAADLACLILDFVVEQRLSDGAPGSVLAEYRRVAREAGLGLPALREDTP